MRTVGTAIQSPTVPFGRSTFSHPATRSSIHSLRSLITSREADGDRRLGRRTEPRTRRGEDMRPNQGSRKEGYPLVSSGALGGPPRFLSLRSFPRRTAFGRLRRVCDGGRMTTEHGELRKEGPYRCSPNQEAIWALSSLSHRYHYCLTLLPRLSRFIPSLRYTLLRSVRDA